MDTTLQKSSANEAVSKLFILTSIESKEPIDCLLEESYLKLQTLINLQLADSVLHNELIQYTNQSKQHSDELSNALLYLILTEQQTSNSQRYLRYLLLCNNNTPLVSQAQSVEAYGILITNLANISLESYNKLHDTSRQQLLWIIKELVKIRFVNCDKILYHMIRNVQGGNLSEKNLWLAEMLLNIFLENLEWLYLNQELLHLVLYTYLRILADHQSTHLSQLRQREIDFCIQILREKWHDCILIGRDLVRLLQNLSKIPEFEALWKDIIAQPAQLNQQFAANGGLLQLLRTQTRRRYIIARLTPDMERKIYFLLTNVKFGLHKRYQDWFQKQYLNTPESQTLRVDLIRYICAVVHPTNEQLNSGLTPRWAVIGWLLNTCTNSIECANIKLALFFDWLFYDSRKDNIMLIEPAILIMLNSIRVHTNITIMLLEFLCRIVYTYCPAFKDAVCQGITNAFRDSVEKRVIPSMNVIYDCGKLDKDIKVSLQAAFPLVFGSPSTPTAVTEIKREIQEPIPVQLSLDVNMTVLDNPVNAAINSGSGGLPSPTSSSTSILQACFSDDDSQETKPQIQQQEIEQQVVKIEKFSTVNTTEYVTINKPIKVFLSEDINQIQINTHTSQLNENLNKILTKLNKSINDYDMQSVYMEELLTHVLKYEKNFEQTYDLAQCILFNLKTNFSNTLIPNDYLNNLGDEIDNDTIQDIINKRPIFVLFKFLCQTENDSTERQVLLQLIKDIYLKQKRISYYFLYYLCINKDDENIQIYKEMVQILHSSHADSTRNDKDESLDIKHILQNYLLDDLQLCEEDDSDLFFFMIFYVYKHFAQYLINNIDMLHLIVSCIDARQLNYLISLIICDDLKLFKTTITLYMSFVNCIQASLNWETIEQIFFWKLLQAHNHINVEYLLPCVLKLDKNLHSEAICALFQLLKTCEPTLDIIQCFLNRKIDNISHTLFIYWSKHNENDLKQIFSKLIQKSQNYGGQHIAQNKKKHVIEIETPTIDQILSHLDQLRHNSDCLKFILDDLVQENLQNVYKNYCNDDLKRRYADLFTLIDEFDDYNNKKVQSSSKISSANKANKTQHQTKRLKVKTGKKSQQSQNSTSDSDFDENETSSAKQPPRKKLKPIVNDNDNSD